MASKDIIEKLKQNAIPPLLRELKSSDSIKIPSSFSKKTSTSTYKQLIPIKTTNHYLINEELKSKLIAALIRNNQIVFDNSFDQLKKRMDVYRENNQLLTSLNRLKITNKIIKSSQLQKQIKLNITRKSNANQNSSNQVDSTRLENNEICITNKDETEVPNSTDLAEEYSEIYRYFVGGKKIDLNKHNIFLWLTAYEVYTSKKDDDDRLDNLSKYFDKSLQKVINSFIEEKSNYKSVKEKLFKFVCAYLDRYLNPITEKQFNKIRDMFEEFDFTIQDKKYLLNCYCDCSQILADPISQSKFSFSTLFLLEKYKMNLK